MADISIIIYYIVLICLITAVPVKSFFEWLAQAFHDIDSQLDKQRYLINFSYAPLRFILTNIANFAKGYFLIYFSINLFNNNFLIVLTVFLALIAHNWSVFLKFKNQEQFFMILWGIFTYFSGSFLILFPLCYLIFSLIFNSFIFGWLTNLFLMFLWLWFLQIDQLYLMINASIFILIFVALSPKIFIHFEQKPITILKSFQDR